MILPKLLIVDDKKAQEDLSSARLYKSMDETHRACVEMHGSSEGLWIESSGGDDITLLRDLSAFPFIFIHDSFDNPLVHDGLRPVLVEKLSRHSTVVLFSGSKKDYDKLKPVETDPVIAPGTWHVEIMRRRYFENFIKFVDSGILFGEYDLNYLYDTYSNPRIELSQSLVDEVRFELEVSVAAAMESKPFLDFLKLHGVTDHAEVKRRMADVDEDELISWLESFYTT